MGLNSLTFGNVNTLDYGVYILSDPTFNAPKRVYETVEVPGRNGLVAIDEGYYENITITYPAYIEADTFEEFSEKVSDFRNALMSQSGYQRLYNTYHPDEYRMALFQDDFILDITKYLRTGRFDLTFNCKPQRYLVSGETPIEVTSGSKLVNPTYFDARPLIVVNASDDGIVYVNDKTIGYMPESIGKMELDNTKPTAREFANTGTLFSAVESEWTTSRYNEGDTIGANGEISFRLKITFPGYVGHSYDFPTNMTVKNVSENFSDQSVTFSLAIPKNVFKFVAGGSKTINAYISGRIRYEESPSSGVQETAFTFTLRMYNTSSYPRLINIEGYGDVPTGASSILYNLDSVPTFYVDSTVAAFDGDVYFDTEACEAYVYGDDGKTIAINNVVVTGADYPKLNPGENGISYFGGINSCKIIPRWWKI